MQKVKVENEIHGYILFLVSGQTDIDNNAH